MSLSFQIAQIVALAAIGLFSLRTVLRKLMPDTYRRAWGRLASTLGRSDRAVLLRRLGRILQPPQTRAGSCGDGNGCSNCAGCGSAPYVSPLDDPQVKPITIRPYHGRSH